MVCNGAATDRLLPKRKTANSIMVNLDGRQCSHGIICISNRFDISRIFKCCTDRIKRVRVQQMETK